MKRLIRRVLDEWKASNAFMTAEGRYIDTTEAHTFFLASKAALNPRTSLKQAWERDKQRNPEIEGEWHYYSTIYMYTDKGKYFLLGGSGGAGGLAALLNCI